MHSGLVLAVLLFCLLLFLIILQDVEELKYFIPRKDTSFVNEKEKQDGSSDSSSEERNFAGCHEGLPRISLFDSSFSLQPCSSEFVVILPNSLILA